MSSIIYDTKYAIREVAIDDSSCSYLCVLGVATTDEQTLIFNAKYHLQ